MNRNQFDIIADILSISKGSTRKTRIMYRCNLSHKQLEVYIKMVQDLGFAEWNGEGMLQITARGIKFLVAYKRLVHTLSFLG